VSAATALAAVCTAGLAVTTGVPGCITAPPPDLPQVPDEMPRILHNSVFPPADQDLTALPADGSFIVPVVLSKPGNFVWQVYVDFYPDVTDTLGPIPMSSGALDGGIVQVPFTLQPADLGDPNACHWISFSVADSFQLRSHYTPGTTLGSDSVVWRYVPNGPASCLQYDAGDGAFPPDARADAPLPQTPDGVAR
jgi:hypothetical protein